MSQPFEEDSFCLECYWQPSGTESNLDAGLNCRDMHCWHSPGLAHDGSFSPCEADLECCSVDDCSPDCTTVCDGFVDCDKSTVCSEPHCDDSTCQNTATACFDRNCIGENCGIPEHDACAAYFTPHSPFDWGSADLTVNQAACELEKHGFENTANPFLHQIANFDPLEISTPVESFHGWCPAPYDTYSLQPGDGLTGVSCLHSNAESAYINSHDDTIRGRDNFDSFAARRNPISSMRCRNNDPAKAVACVVPPCPHQPRYQQMDIPLTPLSSQLISGHNTTTHSHSPSARSTPGFSFGSSPKSTQTDEVSAPLTSTCCSSRNDRMCVCKWEVGNGEICGLSFHKAGELQEHLAAAHSEPTSGAQGQGYYCRWEGCARPHEPFSQKSKLQGHFLTHSNFKSFRCSTCGKTFARQATLERHERSHRGYKPYKCKECGKCFTDSSELKTHMRIHTGEKPFKCNYPGCSFETGDSSNMSSHKLTHGERKHKCWFPNCTKSFTRPDQLKRHLRATHKQGNVTPTQLMIPIDSSRVL